MRRAFVRYKAMGNAQSAKYWRVLSTPVSNTYQSAYIVGRDDALTFLDDVKELLAHFVDHSTTNSLWNREKFSLRGQTMKIKGGAKFYARFTRISPGNF